MRKPKPISPADAASAWARIEPRLDRSGECWIWTGPTIHRGYAQVWCGGVTRRVHRVVFAHFRGDTDLHLDHLCRNPSCCNPSHLDPVTLHENLARGVGSSSWALRDGTCKAGHPLVEGSFRITSKGRRQCVECARQWARQAYARNPERGRARWHEYKARKISIIGGAA